MTIRDARPEDAPFEAEVPQNEALYRRLIDCEQREDLLYSYKYTRMAEMVRVGDAYAALKQVQDIFHMTEKYATIDIILRSVFQKLTLLEKIFYGVYVRKLTKIFF